MPLKTYQKQMQKLSEEDTFIWGLRLVLHFLKDSEQHTQITMNTHTKTSHHEQ